MKRLTYSSVAMCVSVCVISAKEKHPAFPTASEKISIIFVEIKFNLYNPGRVSSSLDELKTFPTMHCLRGVEGHTVWGFLLGGRSSFKAIDQTFHSEQTCRDLGKSRSSLCFVHFFSSEVDFGKMTLLLIATSLKYMKIKKIYPRKQKTQFLQISKHFHVLFLPT